MKKIKKPFMENWKNNYKFGKINRNRQFLANGVDV